jgi:hypothetical protein
MYLTAIGHSRVQIEFHFFFYRERDGMSPTLDNESSKSHRDSFEIDLDSCAEGNKVDHYSEEGNL